MLRRNAIAAAVGGLWILGACSTVEAPARSAVPERAGTVEPVMLVRNSGGVDSDAMYRIGRYYQGQMRYPDAIAAYRKALALDAHNVEARNALAVAYSLAGLGTGAEREFKAAIAQSPGLSHLHANLGYHYLQLGRTEEARAALAEAIRLDPGNARALNNLAAAGGATVAAGPTPTQAEASRAPVPAVVRVAPPAATPAVVATVAAPAIAASAPESRPAATIRELIGPAPVASGAQLHSLAPNVWELRPRLVQPPALAAVVGRLENARTRADVQRNGLPAVIRFEVSNGNGVTGLAWRVGAYLRGLGMPAPRLTNQQPFDLRRTEIRYVAGMEDSARALGKLLGTPADLVATSRIERNSQLRIVLGRDFREIEPVARMRMTAYRQVALAPALAAR